VLVRIRAEVQEVPRPLTAAAIVGDLARILVTGGAIIGIVAAMAAVRIWEQGSRDEQRPVDAIVVLGAAQYDGRPSPVFSARLDHAVALWCAGLAPYLLVTGGGADGDRTTEAAAAREFALEHGIPAEAILGEDRGRNTLDSLRGVARVMRDHDLDSALFVSDPTHMLRVLRIAEDLGIRAYGSPAPGSAITGDLARQARATVHELGALAVYFLGGSGVPSDGAGD
jgi:uncharacterized SAM-binding protein YcdF (DUF218 family)